MGYGWFKWMVQLSCHLKVFAPLFILVGLVCGFRIAVVTWMGLCSWRPSTSCLSMHAKCATYKELHLCMFKDIERVLYSSFISN